MDVPSSFPFTKLKVPSQEAVLWVGSNPTFHRFIEYGLVISNEALYVCHCWWRIAWWRRYSRSDISRVDVVNGGLRPSLRFSVGDRKVTFHTPHDFYKDEMNFDRSVLERARELLTGGATHVEA
jgi:hypothetical protein